MPRSLTVSRSMGEADSNHHHMPHLSAVKEDERDDEVGHERGAARVQRVGARLLEVQVVVLVDLYTVQPACQGSRRRGLGVPGPRNKPRYAAELDNDSEKDGAGILGRTTVAWLNRGGR